jgi:hypothetical protein
MATIDAMIKNIKDNSLDYDDYFDVAKQANQLLSDGNVKNNELGRKIIIYILDNWANVPIEYKSIFTDLISKCGFYPYLEKEKDKIVFDNLKAEIRKELNKSEFIKSEQEIYFHSAQKEVRDILLNTEENLVVSAPTSFGKSLLIEEIVASNKYKNIVVIQPTLALLNETRNNLRKYESSYKLIVRTSDAPSNEKNNLFLLTAERVMEYKDLPKIDFFILDEFYKISQKRGDERYEVLNNACNKLLNKHMARFYFLGPNIDAISAEFKEKYNVSFKKYNYSLVINEENEIKDGEKYYIDNNKNNKELKLFEELLKFNEQTIIYCSSPDMSTKTAINFAKYLERLTITDINTEADTPLISWITENLSYEWDLISCLKNKIGVHNGAFPKHINASIIDYFNSGKLNYLFCTSTIIEGVNTTTKNVIIYKNWKSKINHKIDYFDYKNIKGRSGRMFKHYVGNLYTFYQTIPEEKIEVDIPFVDQENPLNKEIISQLSDDKVKNKNSNEYKELQKLPKEELELLKKNGLSIDGQKAILEYLKNNFDRDYALFAWNGYCPTFNQAEYLLELCFNNLLKKTESANATVRQLAQLIRICSSTKNLFSIVLNHIDYWHGKQGLDYNVAIVKGFQIQRHWFDYKLPKWFGCFNELQKYVCKLKNRPAGDYSLFLGMLENDYTKPRSSILLEFDLPRTAIKKLDGYVPDHIESPEDILNYIKTNEHNIQANAKLSNYEFERLKKEVL